MAYHLRVFLSLIFLTGLLHALPMEMEELADKELIATEAKSSSKQGRESTRTNDSNDKTSPHRAVNSSGETCIVQEAHSSILGMDKIDEQQTPRLVPSIETEIPAGLKGERKEVRFDDRFSVQVLPLADDSIRNLSSKVPSIGSEKFFFQMKKTSSIKKVETSPEEKVETSSEEKEVDKFLAYYSKRVRGKSNDQNPDDALPDLQNYDALKKDFERFFMTLQTNPMLQTEKGAAVLVAMSEKLMEAAIAMIDPQKFTSIQVTPSSWLDSYNFYYLRNQVPLESSVTKTPDLNDQKAALTFKIAQKTLAGLKNMKRILQLKDTFEHLYGVELDIAKNNCFIAREQVAIGQLSKEKLQEYENTFEKLTEEKVSSYKDKVATAQVAAATMIFDLAIPVVEAADQLKEMILSRQLPLSEQGSEETNENFQKPLSHLSSSFVATEEKDLVMRVTTDLIPSVQRLLKVKLSLEESKLALKKEEKSYQKGGQSVGSLTQTLTLSSVINTTEQNNLQSLLSQQTKTRENLLRSIESLRKKIEDYEQQISDLVEEIQQSKNQVLEQLSNKKELHDYFLQHYEKVCERERAIILCSSLTVPPIQEENLSWKE